MSSSACVVFYGLRYEIPCEAVEGLLEGDADPRIQAAQNMKLDVYWANFGGATERFLLLIGKKIGVFGLENERQSRISTADLRKIIDRTDELLRRARFEDEPALFCEWEQDI